MLGGREAAAPGMHHMGTTAEGKRLSRAGCSDDLGGLVELTPKERR
jgi:hypothetical protein